MIRLNIIVIALLLHVLLILSCNKPKHVNPEPGTHHWIELRRPSVGAIYIDSIPLQMVMKVHEDAEPHQKFKAYLIGYSDSTILQDKADLIERNKYYQYDLQHDWVAIAGGQELKPVFYQPRTTVSNRLSEGIVVFETSKGNHPDTLVYADSFGSWGVQKFILKGE